MASRSFNFQNGITGINDINPDISTESPVSCLLTRLYFYGLTTCNVELIANERKTNFFSHLNELNKRKQT